MTVVSATLDPARRASPHSFVFEMVAKTTVTVDGGVPTVTVPRFEESFRPGKVKEIMAEVLRERLSGLEYDADNCSTWCREISDDIKQRLKALDLPRYKWCVQVTIGEQKGAGVRMACRAFWDPKSDGYANETYQNESIFAVAFASGVYLY